MLAKKIFHAALAVALTGAISSLAAASPLPGWPDSHSTAYLGVHIEAVTPEQANALKLSGTNGALVTLVDQDGPACRAGLKDKDVIVGFNGSKVDAPEQLGSLIHSTSPGQIVTLTVVRAGQSREMKVALGNWPTMPTHAQNFTTAVPPMAFAGPVMAAPAMPDIPEVPAFTVLSTRHGLVVEPLSLQMADFFGVPHGRGVFVRSVEKGSPAEAAGLKACDVIVKVNNETVHDMADWGRSMRSRSGKIPVVIVRDKREQTLLISLPMPNTSKWEMPNKDAWEQQMQVLRRQMEELRPQLDYAGNMVAQLDTKDFERMQDDVRHSMQASQQEIARMQKELTQSLLSPEAQAKLRQQIEQSMPSQKDWDQMQRNVQDSLKNLPSHADLENIRHDVEQSLQEWTPQFQQQMEQLRKELEQQKLDLQLMMKDKDSDKQY